MDELSNSARGSSKALVKGLALLDLVAVSGPVGLADLLEGTGLPRPTALRLLEPLTDQHVLEQTNEGLYVLGPRVARWGQRYLDRLDLPGRARDLMDQLSLNTFETCFLGVRDGLRILYVAKSESPQAVQPVARVGSRNPLYCTGIGKALLAFGDPRLLVLVAAEPFERRTDQTLTNLAALERELDETRQRGYALDNIENEEGVRCVAAPVRDHRGEVVAAMSVSAPAYRFTPEDLPRLAPQVVEAAGALSRRLGYHLDVAAGPEQAPRPPDDEENR